MPSPSEEVWRYTPIDQLNLEDFTPVTPARDGSPAGTDLLESLRALIGPLSGHVLVHNGQPGDCSLVDASFGFGRVDEVPGAQAIVGSVQVAGDALVRLNDAYMSDAVVIDVPAGVVVPQPILVVHWCDPTTTDDADRFPAMFPRTSVRLGDNAHASVVEVYAGGDGDGDGKDARSLVVPVTELSAGVGASVSYVSLQILNDAAWFVARLAARGTNDASLRTFTVGLGGDYDRVRADVAVEGRGARSEILSTYLGYGSQVHDIRTLQDHVGPRTTSELLCQGAVAGTSRSVYSGLIRVHRGAVRTDARQTNHNLVLDEGAHADSVPNLDILENDVKCSHASTVGPIDEDQRYYIESRGVSPDVAEGLIVQGFFDAIIDRSPIPAVNPLLRREVHGRLYGVLSNRLVPANA
ncbi:MAG TPA: SufD family Fe-S cluster assembly protein [Acidimicrobiales bacterium]|nr:SufD family Fe-S cluster assembly protein [Acidimicrobiales bacterium]